MHYYQFNIGDYRKQTGHLTLVEHAIYRALLDSYYLTENPLTSDLDSLMRSHSVRSADEQQALKNVLKDFFSLTDNGYEHEHCQQELARLYDKSAKARKAAKARWLKDKDKKADAMQTHSERNADGILPITQDPLPITQVKDSSSVEDCPHQQIIDLYHSQLPQLRKIKVWSDKRQKALRTRWKENTKHQSLEFWERLFSYVSRSDFLTGKKGEWQADLEWIINPTNFIKIIEGKYDA